ncbi:unnamed protein product [Linum tenue]|uniref:Uncharacterized protein n=1 Tax=Linum tenue TaxID=586396 RepID=A0AAV0HVZ8_9ROSI|nr:unnamed protein product [Linum tenue]
METVAGGNFTKLQQQLQQQKKQKWFLLLIASLLISTLLILLTVTFSSGGNNSASTTQLLFRSYRRRQQQDRSSPRFVESKLAKPETSAGKLPRLAYLISGSAGDGVNLKRALKALYHPRNQYVVHLDLEAPVEERLELIRWVKEDEKVFQEVGNVRAVVRSNLVTYRGPTMVSNTLHAAAILLRDGGEWDWFINLSASDYPLVTQDGNVHSSVPLIFFLLKVAFGNGHCFSVKGSSAFNW